MSTFFLTCFMVGGGGGRSDLPDRLQFANHCSSLLFLASVLHTLAFILTVAALKSWRSVGFRAKVTPYLIFVASIILHCLW